MVDIQVPNLGENTTDAEVLTVLVKLGEQVVAEQPILELETDKATFELPSPAGGTVSKIFVKEGDTIQEGQTIMSLNGASSERVTKPVTPVIPVVNRSVGSDVQAKRSVSVSPTELDTKIVAPPTEPVRHAQPRDGTGFPLPASPNVRRLARELGVDLSQVNGSGGGGRITQEDVKAFVRSQQSAGQFGGRREADTKQLPLPDFSQWGPVERQKLSKLARSAAERLAYAWRTIPHVTQHDLADITELESARQLYQKSRQEADPKITMTALAIKAVVTGLKKFPHVNASLDAASGELILKKYFHIGIAVDTEAGLLVPVVKDADQKSLHDIAMELDELARKARVRTVTRDEMQGGTFTITNLGGLGGSGFTPIINPPEVAILGLSRGRTERVLVGADWQSRLMLPLSLSYDHRVINGADAVRFLRAVIELLENPLRLMVVG